MQHVFIIGGTTYDHIVSLPEFPQPLPQTFHQAPFHEATGSTGSGKALCLTKLRVPNSLYSVLGNDIYGEHIIRHLEAEKVELIYDLDPKGTERHFNIMNAEGSRISMFITQSSEFPEMDLNRIKQKIQQSSLIVINIISYCKQIVPLLKNCHKPVWTDLHDYTDGNEYHKPFIEVSDTIFLSSDNLTDYRQTMRNLIQKGKKLVVCTHGKMGATALTQNGEWYEEPGLTGFPIVDANGAGDNFFSGFLYAYISGKMIPECLHYGSLCGAYCITSKQLVYEDLSQSFLEKEFIKRFINT